MALFGDGASAMIIGSDPILESEKPLFELHTSVQEFLPHTEKKIDGMLTEKTGISFKLARKLPQIIEDNVEGFCDKLMSIVEFQNKEYNKLFWVVHPGGLPS